MSIPKLIHWCIKSVIKVHFCKGRGNTLKAIQILLRANRAIKATTAKINSGKNVSYSIKGEKNNSIGMESIPEVREKRINAAFHNVYT